MALDLDTLAARAAELADRDPRDILQIALDEYSPSVAISFSGAEDVALVDMAASMGRPFRIFSLDTGRLHPETYRFLDTVRDRYGMPIDVFFPQPDAVERLVREKGLFSFYRDGHKECCGIRKVEPLVRALALPFPSFRSTARSARPTGRSSSSTRSRGGRRSRSGRTSATTTSRTTRSTIAASSRSAASPARARSTPASTSVKAGGGGKKRRARSAACTPATSNPSRRDKKKDAREPIGPRAPPPFWLLSSNV
jgi:hypothetical protein